MANKHAVQLINQRPSNWQLLYYSDEANIIWKLRSYYKGLGWFCGNF